MAKLKCECGAGPFAKKSAYTRHRSKCQTVLEMSQETYRAAVKQHRDEPATKKPRLAPLPAWMLPNRSGSSSSRHAQPERPATPPQGLDSVHLAGLVHVDPVLPEPLEGITFPLDNTPPEVPHEKDPVDTPRTRVGRRLRPTWKLRDALPEDVGAALDSPVPVEEPIPSEPDHDPSSLRTRPRLVLLATDYVRTLANTFGLRRFYKRRPHRPPQPHIDLESCYAPTASVSAAKKERRTVAEIIFPLPNISAWRFSWHYTNGYKKTQADRDAMQELISRPDFSAADIAGVNFRKLDEQIAAGVREDAPWSNEREGWRTTSITIGIPSGKRATQASRREAAAAARRINRHESAADTPPVHAIWGNHFTVSNFHHKGLCAQITKTLSSDPAARDFVYDPYLVEHQVLNSPNTEQVYGELYNSVSFVRADLRLQNSPREPGCELPRAIVAIMLWSDATVVSQFGNQKVWPAYMYFGNQSKYTRARPTARAAHHIAYFTSLPDYVQDFIRAQSGGKSASAPLITHCRRELFHAQWECLLDDEFIHAYEHGLVIDCMDGVRRRIYPRIFTYSADYPEK
ncbi:hypothetical protein BC628DRAFT_1391483 [Trametes gibbosa]|nr:hypothetical protein BC628DRAFT_1391483 [Trametes gibbosa]